ncbi:MAG TPA: DUF3054 domain-containing protein [Propionibacteriaceae bacterium]|nr:DUF3054 domain-containing protein [Propionibacteriaceae bacterium]
MKTSRALAVDVLGVLTFAILGRSSHHETLTIVGVADTAWPFLVGCAIGAVAISRRSRPDAVGSGVVVWACTVAGGVTLRVLTGDTAQPAFVVVASVSLAVLLLGWRAGYVLIQRSRRSSHQRASV